VVPVVFALVGDVAYTAVDGKPKTTLRLRLTLWRSWEATPTT
jgi:hypothetical protein